MWQLPVALPGCRTRRAGITGDTLVIDGGQVLGNAAEFR